LEQAWRAPTQNPLQEPDFWTDAYLSAFAMAAGLVVLTFGRELARRAGKHARFLAAT
jgi:hypothetical protein